MSDSPSTLVLVPGHWLGAWAWDAVVAALDERGVPATAVTLPGLDPDDPERTGRTLEDQVAGLTAVVEEAREASGRPVVLVAHSGANFPATALLDRRRDLVARVVWVDSGPVADGAVFADLPDGVDELPLPPFDTLGQQASLAGLSEEDLEAFRARAVPEPGAVLRSRLELTDDARREVPATFVCSSFSGEQVLAMAQQGHPMMAEVATLTDVTTVDLPTGHWPMWSRPDDLAEILADLAVHA